MRVICLAAMLALLAPGAILAQPGWIGVFADTQVLDCNLLAPPTPGLVSYYVVHVHPAGGIAGVTFSAPKPACFNAMFVADVNMFPVTLGNTQTGYAVGYGVCRTTNTHIATMQYMVLGATPACCPYWVLPHPDMPSGEFEFSDCDFELVYGGGLPAVINPEPHCACMATPVNEKTWGAVKALYE